MLLGRIMQRMVSRPCANGWQMSLFAVRLICWGLSCDQRQGKNYVARRIFAAPSRPSPR